MKNSPRLDRLTQALTHVLIHPTRTPSLHSQLLFPDLLLPTNSFSLYFHLLLRSNQSQRATWRSKCPYQQPPPLVVSSAVGPADWAPEARRAHFRRRMARGELGIKVPWPVAIAVPNGGLLLLLLWDPLWKSLWKRDP